MDESTALNVDEQSLIEASNLINNQELRIHQRRLEELREQYEAAKVGEMSAKESLRLEKVRIRTQEKENLRLDKQLSEAKELTQKLRTEVEDLKKTLNSAQWEAKERELRASFENELIQSRSRITGLEAKLIKRQQELDRMFETNRSTEDRMQHEITRLKHDLNKSQLEHNRFIESSVLSKKEEEDKHIEDLQRQIGSLTAKNEIFMKEKFEQENELKELREDLHSARTEIAELKKQILEAEGSNNMANQYLVKEMEKIKQQKAQLRCDLLQLKKEHQRLVNEQTYAETSQKLIVENKEAVEQELKEKVEELTEKLQTHVSDQADLVLENGLLKTNMDELQRNLTDAQKKILDAELNLREEKASEDARVSHLTQELEASNRRIESLKLAIKTLDDHSETLMNQIKSRDEKMKRAEETNVRLNNELDELRNKVESNLLIEGDYLHLKEENARLTSRVDYLEAELRETHTDHREELAKLAKQLTLSKSNSFQAASKEHNTRIQYLESELRQKESQLRSFERQVDQAKAEARNVEKEIINSREDQVKLANENTNLRQGLADAIKKIQERDKAAEDLKEANDGLVSELEKSNKRWTEVDDQNQQLTEDIAHKEKLIAYLQSQIQPKQMPKMKHSTTRCSTLLSSGSESLNSTDIENETRQCEELEARRDQLQSTLDQQKKVLAERQRNEAIPLLKGSQAKGNVNDDTWSTQEDAWKASNAKNNCMGTMRHEIPHRWKKQFVSLLGAKCAICLEGVPRFRHAMKCRGRFIHESIQSLECNITVHPNCRCRVANTCGLPVACADYYLDSHITQIGEMNGWVKLIRSDDVTNNKWRNAWATIDGQQLKFADTDNLAVNDGHFLAINLDHEPWRIYNQSGEISGISRENLTMLIEIKLKDYTLYMLTPTVQAKQRWVQALQTATNRRMQRRHSTHPAGNTLLLALDKPQNLGIHCTAILDDWLLIGSEEGLFATNYSSPRSPFNIVGVPSTVYYMELIKEFDMLVAICGNSRSLVAIHLQQLSRVLNESNRSGVSLTGIMNVDNCHLAVVSKAEHCENRYIYAATIDSICVLQYVRKRDMFALVCTIRTEEPCMCITSVPNGVVYGADTFYFASASANNIFEPFPLRIDNCPPDFPVAVVTISDQEILIVYHNFGVFVTPQGRRTRKDNLEWERAPLEFVYSAPYLYIAYCEFLEIVQIAPFEGENSRTITNERDVYRCRSAHHTGFGINLNDVVFTVSGATRVELHVFNASEKWIFEEEN